MIHEMKERLPQPEAGKRRDDEGKRKRAAAAPAKASSKAGRLEQAEQVRALGIVEGQAILTLLDEGS